MPTIFLDLEDILTNKGDENFYLFGVCILSGDRVYEVNWLNIYFYQQAEAQRSAATSPRSHRQQEADLGFDPRTLRLQFRLGLRTRVHPRLEWLS